MDYLDCLLKSSQITDIDINDWKKLVELNEQDAQVWKPYVPRSKRGGALMNSVRDDLLIVKTDTKREKAPVECRICGRIGHHWTIWCPRDLNNPSLPPNATTFGNDKTRGMENSLMVTNLSKDAREPFLLELFRPFGELCFVYVSTDRNGISTGFGFVNFARREDAERAIHQLNGHGYDSLILGVAWAVPRET